MEESVIYIEIKQLSRTEYIKIIDAIESCGWEMTNEIKEALNKDINLDNSTYSYFKKKLSNTN